MFIDLPPSTSLSVQRIVSGGQTGADRAALDWAIENGIEHGGWCPHGRRAEDGHIEAHYQLRETPFSKYVQRSEWNVRDSDGTLSGTIDTVAGPTSHTCDITFDGANPIGDAWVWDDPTAPDDAEDFCRILFRPGQMSLRIDSDSCEAYCGARGYFDQTSLKHG